MGCLLSNPVVVITGAAGGVGLAVRKKFEQGGWNVVGIDVAEISATDIVADLRSAEECRRAIAEATARHNRIDGLVLAAGLWTEGPTHLTTEEEFDDVFDVNVKATYFALSASLPELAKTKGWVTALSSDAGIQGNAGAAVYSASKGAISNLVRAVAREVAPQGIRVNAVCPGDIDTPMLHGQATRFGQGNPQEYLNSLLANYPQGEAARFVKPEEVAALIWFLGQKEAEAITGSNLSIDFGLSAGI